MHSPGSMGGLQIVTALKIHFPGSLGADQLQALSFEGRLRGGLAQHAQAARSESSIGDAKSLKTP